MASVVAESLPDSSYMPLRRIQLQGSLQNVLAEISNIPRMYFNNVGHALMRFCAIPTKLFLLVYYVLLCPAESIWPLPSFLYILLVGLADKKINSGIRYAVPDAFRSIVEFPR